MTSCDDFTCGNVRIGERYDPSQCRKCWAEAHHPDVARSRGKEPHPLPAPIPTSRLATITPCRFIGPDSGPADWHYCEHPQTPLGDIVCSCKGCGIRCPGYEARRNADVATMEPRPVRTASLPPAKRTAINLPGHFNASIIEHANRLLLASRVHSSLSISELDADYRVLRTVQLALNHPAAANGQEDPRLFVHRDKLHVSFAGITSGKTVDSVWINQLYAEIDPETQTVGTIHAPQYAKRQRREKNWAFFEHDGKLYAIYSISPHVVLQIEEDRVIQVHETANFFPWSGGFLRGGTPPIYQPDRGTYLAFFHGNLPIPRCNTHPEYVYSTGVYEFEAKPPFRVVRQSSGPILWAGEQDRVPERPDVAVVFPAGAIRHPENSNRWVVSHGCADNRIELIEWDQEDIELPEPASSYPFAQLEAIQALPGWCTLPKSVELYHLIRRHKPKIVVEIGVFGGRSLIPMALALRENSSPTSAIWGIDDWTREAPTEGSLPTADLEWWLRDELNLDAIKEEFIRAVSERGLWAYVRMVQSRSVAAAALFSDKSIDLIHLDGNHSPEASTRDIQTWLPKVRPGGIVIVDDTERPELSQMLKLVGERCHPYYREHVNEDGIGRWRVYEKLP